MPLGVISTRMTTASIGALALADPQVSLVPMGMMLLLLVVLVAVAARM